MQLAERRITSLTARNHAATKGAHLQPKELVHLS
jgi:hypothetical protein